MDLAAIDKNSLCRRRPSDPLYWKRVSAKGAPEPNGEGQPRHLRGSHRFTLAVSFHSRQHVRVLNHLNLSHQEDYHGNVGAAGLCRPLERDRTA